MQIALGCDVILLRVAIVLFSPDGFVVGGFAGCGVFDIDILLWWIVSWFLLCLGWLVFFVYIVYLCSVVISLNVFIFIWDSLPFLQLCFSCISCIFLWSHVVYNITSFSSVVPNQGCSQHLGLKDIIPRGSINIHLNTFALGQPRSTLEVCWPLFSADINVRFSIQKFPPVYIYIFLFDCWKWSKNVVLYCWKWSKNVVLYWV